MVHKENNKLFVVIRFNGKSTFEFYNALFDTDSKLERWQARDLLMNSCEVRQENNLLVFLVKCSEVHEHSYGIKQGNITTVFSMDDLKPLAIDIYTKYRDIQW